ncbi:MAG: S-methyl-5-thioribose-1-phosphate isomerase [Fimbriimonadia bacterium]
MREIRAIEWRGDALALLDQRLLPQREEYVVCTGWQQVHQAIREMVVRGAPAIGVAGAYAVVLAGREHVVGSHEWERACDRVAAARPTAVNLRWAVERMRTAASSGLDLVEAAHAIHREVIEADKALSRYGAKLLPEGVKVITICNTGALATGGYGTALGVVRAAHADGKRPFVWVLETRPRLQGMRLTAWELQHLGVSFRIVTDGMAGLLMRQGLVDLALVGADRIAKNGDSANKVGTYSLAVLCRAHSVPFYVAAPWSTFDPAVASGDAIPIEEREPEEITILAGQRLAPERVEVYNPAFDVTPAQMITGFITERGILSPPF